jgi:hypothetical protein
MERVKLINPKQIFVFELGDIEFEVEATDEYKRNVINSIEAEEKRPKVKYKDNEQEKALDDAAASVKRMFSAIASEEVYGALYEELKCTVSISEVAKQMMEAMAITKEEAEKPKVRKIK